jgi:hypothetical protein
MDQIVALAQSQGGQPYTFGSTTAPTFDCGKLVKASVAAVESGTFVAELVTVADVELLEVGEDWETSTGLFTWEPEDLLSAIASQDDPSVRSPVLKLGHEDPRFNLPDGSIAPGDGQPAFGRIANLRVENNGQTLVGDYLGVPKWLAEIMPTAYPRRSIEGYFAKMTRTDNKWPFILTAVALLGTKYPAINTLEDLQILWGSTVPPLVEVDDEEAPEVAASADGLIRARKVEPVAKVKSGKIPGVKEVKAAQQAKATTTTSDIQRAFYEQLDHTQSWWWIRQVLVNPLQLVVDDDEGGLYLVDVTVDASDNVTYGEPQKVKVEYVAASAGAAALAEVHKDGQIVAASYEDAVASGGKVKAADGGEDDEEEESDMPKLSDDAIRRLGLDPTKATDDEISAAVLAKISAAAEDADGDEDDGDDEGDSSDDTSDGDDDDTSSDDDASTTTTTTPATPTTTPQVPEGMVLVDSEQWQTVQQEVAASAADRKKNAVKERDNFIAAAVKDGKFPRARADHYKTLWASDPKGTKVLIENLAPGLVPVTEIGSDSGSDVKVEAAYPDSWKQDRRVAAQRNSVSSRVKVVND